MLTLFTRLPIPRLAFRGVGFVLGLIAVCGAPDVVSAQGRGRSLFGAAPPGRAVADAQRRGRPAPRRSRLATVRAELLAADGGSAGPIELDLFDDVRVLVRGVRLDRRSPNAFVWQGRVDGMPGGHVTFASNDGVLAGTVFADTATFEVSYAGDGLYEVQELDPAAFPTDDAPADLAPATGVSTSTSTTAGDSASQQDLLVVWTPAARTAAGGTAAIRSLVDLAVANANTAYANSGVTTRLRLVYSGETPYAESSISTDLNRLASTADGYMDNVHALRDQYGADVVSLIGAGYTAGGSCGIGYLMSSVGSWFASSAFSVVDWSCAAGNLTLAHEVGHNQGLHHDPANANGQGAYAYSYGYVDPGCAFRTVMAYGGCQRVPQFSSPVIDYAGRATGTSSQDNARTLNNTAATVANFRQRVGSSCAYSLSTESLTVAAGGQSASITVSTAGGCDWTATSSAGWIAVTAGASGSGSGSVTLTIAANGGTGSRTGSVAIAGGTVTVTQSGVQACSYAVASEGMLTFNRNGGTGTVTVSTSASTCSWTATSDASWLTISGASQTGSATLRFAVASYGGSAAREAHLAIAGTDLTVTQFAGPRVQALDFDGSGTGDAFLYNATTGSWSRRLWNGTSLVARGSGTWAPGWTILPADFNGDERSDLFLYNAETGQWYKAVSTDGGGFAFRGGWWARGWSPLVLDLDGDGRSDVFLYNSATGQWFQCVTAGSSGDFQYRGGWWAPGWTIHRAAFNVDGRDDLFLYNPRDAAVDANGGKWFRVLTQPGLDFAYVAGDIRWAGGWQVTPADFSGDGTSELFLYRDDGRWFVVSFAGASSVYRGGVWASGWTIARAEFNRDRRADLLIYNPQSGQWFTVLTRSDGAFSYVGGLWESGLEVSITDFDGDGASDVAMYDATLGGWTAAITRDPGSYTYESGSLASGWSVLSSHVTLP